MRIALATDAWRPQTNGVVTTLTRTLDGLERQGHVTRAIQPSDATIRFSTFGFISDFSGDEGWTSCRPPATQTGGGLVSGSTVTPGRR